MLLVRLVLTLGMKHFILQWFASATLINKPAVKQLQHSTSRYELEVIHNVRAGKHSPRNHLWLTRTTLASACKIMWQVVPSRCLNPATGL